MPFYIRKVRKKGVISVYIICISLILLRMPRVQTIRHSSSPIISHSIYFICPLLTVILQHQQSKTFICYIQQIRVTSLFTIVPNVGKSDSYKTVKDDGGSSSLVSGRARVSWADVVKGNGK